MSFVPSYLSRAYRGGSWASSAWHARVACRFALFPSAHGATLALRLVRKTP